jgi:hypothetical protein
MAGTTKGSLVETSEVLDLAADHLRRNGLFKGGAHGEGDLRTAPACTVGAITLMAIWGNDRAAGNVAIDQVRDYIGGDVVAWSDAPGRTAEEVVEALRACAVIEAAREEQDAAWETYAPQVVTA